jgi:hypothetical protein
MYCYLEVVGKESDFTPLLSLLLENSKKPRNSLSAVWANGRKQYFKSTAIYGFPRVIEEGYSSCRLNKPHYLSAKFNV